MRLGSVDLSLIESGLMLLIENERQYGHSSTRTLDLLQRIRAEIEGYNAMRNLQPSRETRQ